MVSTSGSILYFSDFIFHHSNRQTRCAESAGTKVKNPPLFNVSEPDEFKKVPAYKYINNTLTRDLYDPGFDIPNPGLCPESGASLKLLIIIQTARHHSDRRDAIRQTYGHSFALRKDVAKMFIVGRPEKPGENSDIASESDRYGDIVVGRFVDTFYNLTLKTTAALEWVLTYCSKVKYIFKADDDAFYNIPRILDIAELWSDQKRTIIGEVCRLGPSRNKEERHYVSPEVYNLSFYPAYPLGQSGYFVTTDIVKELLERGLRTAYLNIDDTFYAGFIASAIGATKAFHERSFKWHNHTYWAGPEDKNKCGIQDNLGVWAPETNRKVFLWNMTQTGRLPCTGG
ncbi:beta-1,3-galactosyltransferase 1-like [Bemisia tabaci]|uniref:beta-1,3-galactosyltransferase 1-like n=1 Tax=Bemisia tabaci TaxID=7038 RepID=UPI003B28AB9B